MQWIQHCFHCFPFATHCQSASSRILCRILIRYSLRVQNNVPYIHSSFLGTVVLCHPMYRSDLAPWDFFCSWKSETLFCHLGKQSRSDEQVSAGLGWSIQVMFWAAKTTICCMEYRPKVLLLEVFKVFSFCFVYFI